MAISVDNVVTGVTNSATSLTISKTNGVSTTLLVVVVSSGVSLSSPTCTYNGISMTNLVNSTLSPTGTFAKYNQIWYLVNPPTGSAQNVVITPGGSAAPIVGVAVSFSGTSTSASPFGANIGQAGNATSGTVTGTVTTTTANSYLLNSAYIDFAANVSSTPSNGETVAGQNDSTTGNYSINVSTKATPTPGSVTSGWTKSSTDSDWSQILVEILPPNGIGFDSSSIAATSGAQTSLTWSHTNNGNILFVSIASGVNPSGDVITGLTYNSVAMTQVGKAAVQTNTYEYLYILENAPTGTHNIVASASTSTGMNASAASYFNAAISGQPDGSSSNTGSGTSLTGTVTTTKDNDWLVLAGYSNNGSTSYSSSNGVVRATASSAPTGLGGFATIVDSNGAKTPPGSYNIVLSFSSNNWGYVVAGFSPVSTSSPSVGAAVLIRQAVNRASTY